MMILEGDDRQCLIILIMQFLHEEGYKRSLSSLEQESSISETIFKELKKSGLLSLISQICPNRSNNPTGLKQDLIFLILQFLDESHYNKTLFELEKETKLYFHLSNFSESLKTTSFSDFLKAQEYLVAFTTDSNDVNNKYSKAMFLEIKKLESPESSLGKLVASINMLAKKNPVLSDKLSFPEMESSRLEKLMKVSLEWWRMMNYRDNCGPVSLENIPKVAYLCSRPMKKRVGNFKIYDAMVLPDCFSQERIARLTYSAYGDYILALGEDGIHKLWRWLSWSRRSSQNVFPEARQIGKTMKNERAITAVTSSCLAIKGSYLFSTSGSRISVFDLKCFEKVAAFGSLTPMATYFIFIPDDLLAVGLDDGFIVIYCLSSRKVKAKLEGHDHQRITCLAFSCCFNVLVSSGADGKLCVWNAKSWLKLTSYESSSLVAHVQFDPYQIELLVVHERWISVHEARTLDCVAQWFPKESTITCATYSSDGGIIYVGFTNGYIKVLESKTLQTISRINMTAFTSQQQRLKVYPVAVVSHPSLPSQISAGLTNGKVIVLQPLGRRGWNEVEAALPDDHNAVESSNGSNY